MTDTTSPSSETGKESAQDAIEPQRQRALFVDLGAIILIAVAALMVYSSVLFSWFGGDDFVHLAWLRDAVHQPELIWRNFHDSWLGLTNTKFYRPLISVFMVSDYLMWGTNGLGFHVTNVIFLIVSSISLYFIMRNLSKGALNQTEARCSALAAGLLFAIYPLHTEAVSWITGRVDAVVTAFSLLSIWLYLQWRQSKSVASLSLCWATMVLGLLSKEMALTLPAVFFLYDVIVASEQSSASWLSKAIIAAKNTAPFWLTLVGYFIVRRIALGTFVGGYDNSLFFISDFKRFLLTWVHAVHMTLVPANRELMGSHNLMAILWQVGLLASLILTGFACLKDASVRRRALFLISWIACSLAPVYKIFSISDDLQGSRLAYLATAPLVCLLTLGFLRGRKQASGVNSARSLALPLGAIVLMLISGGYIIGKNNSAWAQAGATSNAIRSSLQKYYDSTPGDPQVLIAGMPDTINGAYVVRNGLPGMTKTPQLSRDIYNALMVNVLEPVLPLGFCKDSMARASDKVIVLAWDQANRKFNRIETANFSNTEVPAFKGSPEKLLSVKDGTGMLTPLPDGSVEVSGSTQRPIVTIKAPSINCFNTNFVAVDVDVKNPGDGQGADLFYKDKIVTAYDLHHRVSNHVFKKGPAHWLFTLHALPEWTLGETGQLELQLPRGADITIESIKIQEPAQLMPTISFDNSGYFGTKGFAHLSSKDTKFVLNYNAQKVAGAQSVRLEITRPNLYFEEDQQNTNLKSKMIMSEIACPAVKGTIKVERQMFPSAGLYELRPYAIDRKGARVGVSGDHIVIAVDS